MSMNTHIRHTYVYIFIYSHMYVCRHVTMYTHTYTYYIHAYKNKCVYVCPQIQIKYIYVIMDECMCVHMYVCMYISHVDGFI